MGRFRTGALAAGLVVLLVRGVSAQSEPTIGEVARRNAERQRTTKPATRVYSNADLKPVPDRSSSTATADVPAGGYISKSTGEAVSAEEIVARSQEKLARNNANMGESFWRREAASLRSELERARREVDTLSTAPKPQTIAMQRIAGRELEKWQRVLAGLEQRWERLEDSAHYANVPKAWLEPQ